MTEPYCCSAAAGPPDCSGTMNEDLHVNLDRHLTKLALSDPAARRAALEEVLTDEGLPFSLQEPAAGAAGGPVRNYLLTDASGALCPLLLAHYDAYPGSTGANDNAAALCILIDLAAELKKRGIPADFAFLDGEEAGHTGARLLQQNRPGRNSVVINLDMCGYGDTITVYARGSQHRPGARPFCRKKLLAAHAGLLVPYLPEGDDVCFSTRQQPVLSVAVMPKWDVQYLKAMAAQGSGLLGRTPEFRMMTGQMEVAGTMHGGFRDAVRWVRPEAMQQVYDYLLDGLSGAAGC